MTKVTRYHRHAMVRLGGTSWAVPLPDSPDTDSVEWMLRYGSESQVVSQGLTAAAMLGSYRALLEDGTTEAQVKRLRELRRVLKKVRR